VARRHSALPQKKRGCTGGRISARFLLVFLVAIEHFLISPGPSFLILNTLDIDLSFWALFFLTITPYETSLLF